MAGTRDPISGAMQWNPMLVGPKRYGTNASSTATSGTLPKEGYRQRDRDKALRTLINQRLAKLNGGRT